VSVTAVDETNPPRGCGQQYAAADAENLHREISEERYAGEQDGDDPDLARIDAAKWSNRIVLQDRQGDAGHGQQHQSRPQFGPGDLLNEAVNRLAGRRDAGGGHCRRCSNAHIPDQRIGAQRKGEHGSDCGRRRVRARRPILLAAEQRNHRREGGKARAKDDSPSDARRAAVGCLRDRARDSAKQTGNCEGTDAGGAAAGLRRPPLPGALKSDHESDADRECRSSQQLIEFHL